MKRPCGSHAARSLRVGFDVIAVGACMTAEWLDLLGVAGIPAGPINTISRALPDPQAVNRRVRIQAEGGALGRVPMVGNPMRIDGARADAPLPPPALGERSDEILAGLGLDEAERRRLRLAKVIDAS